MVPGNEQALFGMHDIEILNILNAAQWVQRKQIEPPTAVQTQSAPGCRMGGTQYRHKARSWKGAIQTQVVIQI